MLPHLPLKKDRFHQDFILVDWISGLPLDTALALGSTFADVEDVLWRRVKEKMKKLQGESAWIDWLMEHCDQFNQRAQSFWAREGRAPGWSHLVKAADLLLAIRKLRESLDRISTSGELIAYYAREGWQVDYGYRRFREDISNQSAPYDRFRDRCARSYRDGLAKMNERLSYLMDAEGQLPSGVLAPQDRFWEEAMAQMVRAGHSKPLPLEPPIARGCAIMSLLVWMPNV